MSDFNKKVIQEFRENQGKVAGPFQDMTLLLLHTRGARTRQLRINPLATVQEGDSQIIAASNAGADSHPDWFYNLVADPEVIIEIGSEKYLARADIVLEPERTRLYALMSDRYPGFLKYEQRTSRVIPVIKLTRL